MPKNGDLLIKEYASSLEHRRVRNLACGVDAAAYRLDQTLRRASAPTINCRMDSSLEKVGGMITGSTSTSPENIAGVLCAASVLNNFTRQTGHLLWGLRVRTQHTH